ncbi:MAG TPA: HAMP domain-containing histidine kinase [Bacteroidetes bacterium]|nr:HAMP domain-containing histidine kinase [Bacteroidota bacterium]
MKLNRLYWKISATLLALLALIGVVYILISAYTAGNYFKEVNQQLYGDIAQHMVKESKVKIIGERDTAMHTIMHSMMAVNPSIEVYLLDTEGNILDFVVPHSTVVLKKVNVQPIKKFLENKGKIFVEGDDPKSKSECNVFSAAPILEDGQLTGYAYIILEGQEQQEVASGLLGSYFLKSGTTLFIASLIGSLLIGLLAIWLITRNLREIIDTVRRFKEGDYKARIPKAGDKDLAVLSTTFNDMADTIEANIEELKSVENLRRELIANVSHDLRTPLAIMQGYAETLLIKDAEIGPADRKKYLQIVLDSSEKLSHLIAQLFEYSKLEANQVQPKKEPFYLAELAHDVLQNYQLIAKEKGVQLEVEASQDLPMVFADVALVERVIQNLMDNALKFTPKGGKIVIALKNVNHAVEVRIADNGPGIPENEQAAIFERYRKAAPSDLKSTKGAGLGLAIVKKILELHNATIRVSSKLNEGTAFMFQLPEYSG